MMNPEALLFIAVGIFALPSFALWRASVHHRRCRGGKCGDKP